MTKELFVDLQKIVDELKRTIAFKDIEIKKLKIKNADQATGSSEADKLLIKELRHELAAKGDMVRSLCIDSAEQETLLEKHGVEMYDGYSNIGIEAGISQLIDKYEAKLAAPKYSEVPDELRERMAAHQQPDEFPGPYTVNWTAQGRFALQDKLGNDLITAIDTCSHLHIAADCMNFVRNIVVA